MPDLSQQERPRDSTCPNCGAEPTDESIRKRHLSKLGYRHEDIYLECTECDEEWIVGVPIGEFDREEDAADLWCDSCDETWMLVHRVRPMATTIELHLKCPHCLTFGTAARDLGERRIGLVGYPQITGETEGCDPYGYPAPDADANTDDTVEPEADD
jgi:transcription elongation factor Elf1